MKKPVAKPDRKQPAEDDEDVWNLAASTIDPLKKKKQRFHPAAERIRDAKPSVKASREVEIKSETPKVDAKKPAPPASRRSPDAVPAQLAEFDRRNARRIRSGQIDIEARIDLHGLRQSEAHASLVSFLLRSHASGLRYVLVITGKGKSNDTRTSESRDSGVLRRNVPRWLAEPELRRIVVSHAPAAIRHGGEGAIYIHIRSRDRA